MAKFNPNAMTFDDGLKRIQYAIGGDKLVSGDIVTSQDERARAATQKLLVDNVPEGFSKWQLPVFLEGASQFFMSFAAPNAQVPQHSHNEGDGIRVILSGSIIYNGRELKAGDWMFIPKGVPYSFEVGPMGAGQFYCYQCCCA